MTDASLVIYIVVSMGILMVFGITILWFFFYAHNQISILKWKENEILVQNQKVLLLNTIKTQENERNFISAELHDDVVSKLNVLKLNFHMLRGKAEVNKEMSELMDLIESTLNQCILKTRDISHSLSPLLLKKFGFHYTLDELAESLNTSGIISINIENQHLFDIKDELKQLHIFRILQELINNTIKHAKASNIEITFNHSDPEKNLLIYYLDDGIGFNPDDQSLGLGLSNIKTRTILLNGEFHYAKTDNKMTFILKLPVHE